MSTEQPVDPERPERAAWRWTLYSLLILVAVGGMAGRVMAVRSKSGRTPMLSANDRSRWATVRALVDHHTYAIEQVSFPRGGRRDPEWHSIDMVRHRGPDGREHYYSSKPTLYSTLVAIPYWILRQTCGATLATHSFFVIRILLILCNVLPTALYLLVLAWTIERFARSDYGRFFAMLVAVFGTYLTTFAVTLNNHVPAAICVAGTVAVLLRIQGRAAANTWWFAAAGLLASFAVTFELPALSFCGLTGLLLFWRSPRQTILGFVPAMLLVAAAAIGTNFVAHGTWSTPYAHRRDGPVVMTLDAADLPPWKAGDASAELVRRLEARGLSVSRQATLSERPEKKGWTLWDQENHQRWAIHQEGNRWQVREWDNWYEYDGSYWSSGNKQGVDRGEPSRQVYAFHVLIGHHGIFSLTPVWLLSVAGIVLGLKSHSPPQRVLAATTLLLTVVCLAFYIGRPLEDRNYGGVSCCLRWSLWLVPLWLFCLVPACDALSGSRTLRRFAAGLLLVSVFSATYNGLNPWSHPWLFDYATYMGWLR